MSEKYNSSNGFAKEEVLINRICAAALRLSKAEKQTELKAIFKDFGAEKLSDIDEAEYNALLTRLNEKAVELNA